MSAWTANELDRIGSAAELQISPRSSDGTLRRATTIWVVRVEDDLYVRSWRGPHGHWYRAMQQSHGGQIRAGGVDKNVAFVEAEDGVEDAVDAAYRSKYHSSGAQYVDPMVRPEARATTTKLMPRTPPS
jgi:hypothetical protein